MPSSFRCRHKTHAKKFLTLKPVRPHCDTPILWSKCHLPLAGWQGENTSSSRTLSLELAPKLAEIEPCGLISAHERGWTAGAPSSTLALSLGHSQTVQWKLLSLPAAQAIYLPEITITETAAKSQISINALISVSCMFPHSKKKQWLEYEKKPHPKQERWCP